MRTSIRAVFLAGLLSAIPAVIGCGGNGAIAVKCSLDTVITVSPPSATVNHAAAPPGNQVQFVAVGRYAAPPGSDCAVPALAWLAYGTWSNPDPTAIQISSANDSTNGTAVCLAPTNGPVTLTGSFPIGANPPAAVQSVQLTCN
jgi:hypothetical protein